MASQEIKELCTQIRRDILRMVFEVQSGHPGGSLGCVELFVALYKDIMNYSKPFDMEGKNQDVFYLSNGHISPVWYSTLARLGMIAVSELKTFRKLNSKLQGHPTTAEHLDYIRIASGSLGQGLSVACGHALTKRMNQDESHVFVLMGDGELQEGQIWEAAMFGAFHQLHHLIAIVDYNQKQIDGPVDTVLSLGDLNAKWTSFGWKVLTCDGNNYDELSASLRLAKSNKDLQPICILMQTKMGKGVDFMEDNHKWHGSPPNQDQMNNALAQLQSNLVDY